MTDGIYQATPTTEKPELIYVFGFVSHGGIGGFEWGFDGKGVDRARMRFFEDGDRVTELRADPLSALTGGDESFEAIQDAFDHSPYFWELTQ